MNHTHTAAGFQVSFLLHAAVLSLVLSLGHIAGHDRMMPIVIDFSTADSMKDAAEKPAAAPSAVNVRRERDASKPVTHRSLAKATPRRPPARAVSPAPSPASIEGRVETVNAMQNKNNSMDDAKTASEAPSDASGHTHTDDIQRSGSGDVESTIEAQKNGYIKRHFLYIRDMIMQNLSYPMIARKMGWSGRVVVAFTILENGCVEDIKIVKTSGVDCLDKNAIETIKKTAPFPMPPVKAQLIIPIEYRLS